MFIKKYVNVFVYNDNGDIYGKCITEEKTCSPGSL